MTQPLVPLQVVQPFDTAKFNFTKALQKEVLFQFEAADMPSKGSAFLPMTPVSGSPNLIFINVSPIEYGHVLLVPRALDRLNQLVDPSTLHLALQFTREAANPFFRLAFNSLGAYGTVNHLHFQVRRMLLPLQTRASNPLWYLGAAGSGSFYPKSSAPMLSIVQFH